MATAALVSIAEYERMSFERDVEYVDGELRERPVVMSVHGLIQVWLGTWFSMHAQEWQVKAAVEVRTRVAGTRVRLPDVVVGPKKRWPQTLVEPPLLVIEIVSPDDRFSDLKEVVEDYQNMGIENIWVIDPQKRVGWVCESEAWRLEQTLHAKNGPMYVELRALWASLDEDEEPGLEGAL